MLESKDERCTVAFLVKPLAKEEYPQKRGHCRGNYASTQVVSF